jgi:hypothetical protein
MSLNLVPYPTGIDYPISQIQRILYERLYVNWGLSGMTGANFEFYGRTYRNSSKDGYLPQWYKSGIDYNEDMFYNDKLQALMWFGLNDPLPVNDERMEYNLSLYAFLNLTGVRPVDGNQRMDEKAIRDILHLLQTEPYGFVTTQVYRDVDNVLQKYSGAAKNNALVNNNHQPYMCVRIDGKLAIALDEYNDCQPSIVPTNFSAMTGAIRANIKDTPNPLAMQTLVNGVQIPLEYQSGSTLTIPHIVGRYVFPELKLNRNVLFEGTDYTLTGDTFDFSPNTLYDGDLIIFNCNENN